MDGSPLFDDMIESIDGLVVIETFCDGPFATPESPRELFGERFMISQLAENGLVGKVGDILGIVERRRS